MDKRKPPIKKVIITATSLTSTAPNLINPPTIKTIVKFVASVAPVAPIIGASSLSNQ